MLYALKDSISVALFGYLKLVHPEQMLVNKVTCCLPVGENQPKQYFTYYTVRF